MKQAHTCAPTEKCIQKGLNFFQNVIKNKIRLYSIETKIKKKINQYWTTIFKKKYFQLKLNIIRIYFWIKKIIKSK